MSGGLTAPVPALSSISLESDKVEGQEEKSLGISQKHGLPERV
jgi:hypothetical protein